MYNVVGLAESGCVWVWKVSQVQLRPLTCQAVNIRSRQGQDGPTTSRRQFPDEMVTCEKGLSRANALL